MNTKNTGQQNNNGKTSLDNKKPTSGSYKVPQKNFSRFEGTPRLPKIGKNLIDKGLNKVAPGLKPVRKIGKNIINNGKRIYNSPNDSTTNQQPNDLTTNQQPNDSTTNQQPNEKVQPEQQINEPQSEKRKDNTFLDGLKSGLGLNKTHKNKGTKDYKKEETEGDISGKIRKEVTKYLIKSSSITTLSTLFLLFIVIIMVILAPMIYIEALQNKFGSFGQKIDSTTEKLGNFLTFRGWCTDEECQENEKEDFYVELDKTVDKYSAKYGVRLNKYLITATLTYSNPFANSSDNVQDVPKDPEELENFIEDKSNMIDFKKSKKKIELLAKNMVGECLYKDGKKEECVKKNGEKLKKPDYAIDENGNLKPSYLIMDSINEEGYKAYLQDDFIRNYYFNGKTGTEIDVKINAVIKSIFSKSLMFEKNDNRFYQKVYASCPGGVTVTSENGKVEGTYPLEEYIAGVVRHEVSDGGRNEAHKALAVAARTYALKVTDNCSKPIKNSQSAQTTTVINKNDYAKKAAEATAGKVLIHKDKIFLSEYDSFCRDCEIKIKNNKHCSIYHREPNGEKNEVCIDNEYYDNYANGGHGYGMSQVAAYEMSDKGSKFDEILRNFYSPGTQIVDMITFSGTFTTGKLPPKDYDELKERADFYASVGTVKLGPGQINLGLIYSGQIAPISQCPWFAKSRAAEIIYYSNMPEDRKYELYNVIVNSSGDGGKYYSNELKEYFERTSDYTKPMPGSIVSWTSRKSDGASHDYGHVAIIESVDYENRTVVMTDSYNTDDVEGVNIWPNVGYRNRTLSFEDIRNFLPGYTFNGYVYLLGKGGKNG